MRVGWLAGVLLLGSLAACRTTGGAAPSEPDQEIRKTEAEPPAPLPVTTLIHDLERHDRTGLLARITPLRRWYALDNGRRVTGTVLLYCFDLVETYGRERATCVGVAEPAAGACLKKIHETGAWRGARAKLPGPGTFPEACGFALPSFDALVAANQQAIARFTSSERSFLQHQEHARRRYWAHHNEAAERVRRTARYRRADAAAFLCGHYVQEAGMPFGWSGCAHGCHRVITASDLRRVRRDFVAAGGTPRQSRRTGRDFWCAQERSRDVSSALVPDLLDEVKAERTPSAAELCARPEWQALTAAATDPMFASCQRTANDGAQVPLPEPLWTFMDEAKNGGTEFRYQVTTEDRITHHVFAPRAGKWHFLRSEQCDRRATTCASLADFAEAQAR